MKNFNKQIQITVELDTIANMLLDTMSPNATHRENIVESIIGRLASKDDNVGMTVLYNALNGFNNDINFQVGENVICNKKIWAHWTQDSRDKEETVNQEIGNCEVIEVDAYRDDKIKIKYNKPRKDGTIVVEELWVNHSSCSKQALELAV